MSRLSTNVSFAVLNEFIYNDNASASDIVARTGVSAATVSRVIKNLKNENIIKFVGKKRSEKGRCPELHSINEDYGFMLHYNFTSAHIHGYLLDIQGTVRAERSIEFRPKNTIETLLSDLESLKGKLLNQGGAKPSKLLAAGFAVPGIVDHNSQIILMIPEINILSNPKFFEYAERVLKVPILGNNSSWLATLGEKVSVYPFINDFVYISVSKTIGIGMGIMIDGKLVKGGRNYAGEVGQTIYNNGYSFDEYKQGNGQFESEASLQTVYTKLEKIMDDGGATILRKIRRGSESKTLTLKMLEDAAERGDEDVIIVLEELVKAWATIVVNIDLLINPELIVIGEGVSAENTYIKNRLDKMIDKLDILKPEVQFGVQGEKAKLIGGTQLLREYVYNEVIANKLVSQIA